MAVLCGKWQLCSSENFDAYMLDIGTTPENLEKAKMALSESSGLVQEISGAGNAWTLKTVTKFGERCNDFTLGQPIDTKTLDERPVKVTLSVEGDSLVETVQGPDFQSKNVRTVSGDTLTMVMTSGKGVSATRKYKKIG